MDAINYRQVAVVDPVGHLHEGHLLLLQINPDLPKYLPLGKD